MGNAPSCGRRDGASAIFHLTRKEVTRATPYQGTAHSTTVELVPHGAGTRVGHRCLLLFRNLPENLLQVAAPLHRQPRGSLELGRSLPTAAFPSPAGRDPDGPAAPALAAADRVWPPTTPVAPAAHGPPGRPECVRHPPGAAAGGAADPTPESAEAPQALRHAPPRRLCPGRHQVRPLAGGGPPRVPVHGPR